jgi:hypothetical protein
MLKLCRQSALAPGWAWHKEGSENPILRKMHTLVLALSALFLTLQIDEISSTSTVIAYPKQ